MKNTRILAVYVAIAVVGVALAGQVRSVIDLSGRKSLLTQRETELAEVKREQSRLKKQAADVKTPEFVEHEAREKLGMGKEGETIVLLPVGETAAKQTDVEALPEDRYPTWQRWIRLFF